MKGKSFAWPSITHTLRCTAIITMLLDTPRDRLSRDWTWSVTGEWPLMWA